MISELQHQLNEVYQVGVGYDVRDFLITDPMLARCLGGESMLSDTSETLLMSEDGESFNLSLFLDSEMLGRLRSSNPLDNLRAEQLDDLWKVLEGISHFNYVVWKVTQGRSLSLLELELQAEIDKFVSTMQLALDQGDASILDRLHSWLFDEVSFHGDLNEQQLDRYKTANDYAARYCRGVQRCLIDGDQRALGELRFFYRLPLADKISHIHSQVWSGVA